MVAKIRARKAEFCPPHLAQQQPFSPLSYHILDLILQDEGHDLQARTISTSPSSTGRRPLSTTACFWIRRAPVQRCRASLILTGLLARPLAENLEPSRPHFPCPGYHPTVNERGVFPSPFLRSPSLHRRDHARRVSRHTRPLHGVHHAKTLLHDGKGQILPPHRALTRGWEEEDVVSKV